MTNRFMTATEVAEYMGISLSKAYKIIHSMNEELRAKGYITVSGKVSRVYFEEKVYGAGAAIA